MSGSGNPPILESKLMSFDSKIEYASSHALRGNSVRPRRGLQRGALPLHSFAARGNEKAA